LEGCKKVYCGDWSYNAPSLNEYKQKFGFKKVDLPMYVKYNPLITILKRIKKLRRDNKS
jgi:hypothetical protein